MPRYGSDDVAFLLIDGRDVLGFTTTLEDTISAEVEDTQPLGADWPTPEYVGKKHASLSQEGYYDDAADGSNAALVGQEGVSRLLCYGVEGNTAGKKFVGYSGAMQVGYTRVVSSGELHKSKASYEGSGAVEEGVILHPLGVETADGDSEGASSVDAGASSAAGGAGYLQVTDLDLDGYDDLAVKVRHSADDVTYADKVTFTAVTAANSAERKAVTGTVNRHLAAAWSFTGTGTSPSATFMVGFARG